MDERVLYPESLTIRLKAGTRARIDRIAELETTTASAWCRRRIERSVRSVERAVAKREAEESST